MCRAVAGVRGAAPGVLALLVLNPRGSGQGRSQLRAQGPPAPLFPSPGTVCAIPYHCLNSKLSYLIPLDFKTALEEKKAAEEMLQVQDGTAARLPLLGCLWQLTRHIHSKPESNQWILQSLLALTLAPRMGEWIPTAYSTSVLPLNPLTQ